ncbi:MAG: prolipoprotein diacylglyceryl transferase, partial [Isosphaeraceae bacterium]
MRRVLWESHGVTLHSFSVFLSLAVVAGLGLTVWRARRERLSTESVLGLAVWLLTGGIVGARALYVATHPGSIQTFYDVFKIWQGGIVYYGCLIGGLIGSTLYWYRQRFPFLAMADAVAPALALGSAVGRIGCWLNGCCYGRPCDPAWGVAFPQGSPPWARHVADGL